ncbi:Zinc finger MYND domain-containing protein 12 [Sparganum proliferum]
MCNNTFCGPTGRAPTSIPPPGNPFYPLANPKGTDLKCEVCSKPAYLQCSLCHVTYYCGLDHQKIDWISIHERICSTLANLRKPISFIASEDERRKKKEETLQLQIQMVELTQMIGQKLLFEGKPEEAVPAALQCLKFTVDAYGLASVELVTPYLILAESSIGLNRLDQAEAYLAQAQWTMLKTQHQCSNAIRSQLQRKLALLFAAKGDYQAALESLAQDVSYGEFSLNRDFKIPVQFQLHS